jgi:hypothetical protein
MGPPPVYAGLEPIRRFFYPRKLKATGGLMSASIRRVTISVSADVEGNRVLFNRSYEDGEQIIDKVAPKDACNLAMNILKGLNHLRDAKGKRA